MNDEHVDDLIDLYALGALEPGEQRVVDSHIQECARCRALVDERRRLVALLAWTPEQRAPRPGLEQNIRRRIEDLQRQGRRELPPPRRWLSLGSWWPGSSRWVGLAAAALALLLLAGWNVRLQRQLTTLSAQVARQQELVDILHAPDVRLITMAPQPAAPQARGTLIINPDSTDAYLVAAGLPRLPDDRVYQLWLSAGEERTNAGLFRGDEQGEATLRIRSPEPLAQYSGCGITVEPAGGSPRPTGDRVLRSDLGSGQEGW